MNTIELTIELPELTDEAAAMIQEFIYALMDTFDARYCRQIEKYYRDFSSCDPVDNHPF